MRSAPGSRSCVHAERGAGGSGPGPARPHTRATARELVAGCATGGLTDAQLERAAAVLDAAVIEIESDDLLAIPLPALEFTPVGSGVPVVAMGGPRGILQVAGPSGRISDRESPERSR